MDFCFGHCYSQKSSQTVFPKNKSNFLSIIRKEETYFHFSSMIRPGTLLIDVFYPILALTLAFHNICRQNQPLILHYPGVVVTATASEALSTVCYLWEQGTHKHQLLTCRIGA